MLRSFESCVGAVGTVTLGCLATLFSTSCTQAEPPEQVEVVRGAMSGSGVVPDADSPEANVVVQVGLGSGATCSGTLITPQIVVTAAHCLWGKSDACRASKETSFIRIGPRGARPSIAVVADDYAATCPAPFGSDVALLYLAQPVTEASMRKAMPTGTLPAVPRIYPPTFLSPGGAGFGVAGFGAPTLGQRSVKLFDTDGLEVHDDGEGGSYWEINVGDWKTEGGDSGGALFTRNPDGTRHLVGVTKGTGDGFLAPDFMIFTDITRSGTDDWIRGRITEGNVPWQLRHSDAWLEQHGKERGSWWGQLDYDVLPCDPAGDPDCDGWFSQHDNCPTIANPDQADDNDDGIGDVCVGLLPAGEAGSHTTTDVGQPALDPTAPADEAGSYTTTDVGQPTLDPTAPADEAGSYTTTDVGSQPLDPTSPAGDAANVPTQTDVVPKPASPAAYLSAPDGNGSGVLWRAYR